MTKVQHAQTVTAYFDNPELYRQMTEPNWLPLSVFGSAYEQELDVNSKDGAMRHRRRTFTGEAIGEWVDGPAPD